jgi:transposase
MRLKPYPSDLTDAKWAILEPLLPPGRPLGGVMGGSCDKAQ